MCHWQNKQNRSFAADSLITALCPQELFASSNRLNAKSSKEQGGNKGHRCCVPSGWQCR